MLRLISTHEGHSLNAAMGEFCLAFSKQYNYRHNRVGHFWRDRYWCRVVMDDRYALACMRYFAWNAVKAGLAIRPEDWPWCGCRYYVGMDDSKILEFHPTYLGLGVTPLARQRHYLKLVTTAMTQAEESLFNERRRHTSKRFQSELAKHLDSFIPVR